MSVAGNGLDDALALVSAAFHDDIEWCEQRVTEMTANERRDALLGAVAAFAGNLQVVAVQHRPDDPTGYLSEYFTRIANHRPEYDL